MKTQWVRNWKWISFIALMMWCGCSDGNQPIDQLVITNCPESDVQVGQLVYLDVDVLFKNVVVFDLGWDTTVEPAGAADILSSDNFSGRIILVPQATGNVTVMASPPPEYGIEPAICTFHVTDQIPGGTVLSSLDDGANVTAHVGDVIQVNLTSNASTGYSWQVGELDTTVVDNTANEYVSPPEGSPPGTPGYEKWTFTAQQAGTTTLRLDYLPPDGGDAAQTFTVTIDVAAT